MANVKEDLSRQEGTYGAEMIGKLKQMKVFIYGLRGLGLETAKNLILAGPNSVTVHDDENAVIADLGCNFYLKDSDVGKPRGAAVVESLQELNPNVRVSLHTGELKLEDFAEFNVVVITDLSLGVAKILEVNEWCRLRKPAVAFLLGLTLGAAASVFVDMGPQHTINDEDGEPVKTLIVDRITNAKNGEVEIDGDRHMLYEGDHVRIEEVKGMSTKLSRAVVYGLEDEVNDINQTFVVKTTKNPKKFLIGNTTKLGEYGGGGMITQVKVPKVLPFKSLAQTLEEGKVISSYMDFGKLGNPEQQHVALAALLEFHTSKGVLPGLHNPDDARDLVGLAKALNEKRIASKKEKTGGEAVLSVDAVDEAFVTKLSLYARTELPPFTALFGGILAQEITKYTGKYTPIDQWFHFEAFELLSAQVPPDATPVNSRYDHQISVFGKSWQDRLERQRVFIVGCGALGCEYLKFVAASGLATQGVVHATDDDTIELSNLSRQFLFRRQHVKKSKSQCASQAIVEMNPALRGSLRAYQIKVEPKTEDVFNDAFWESLDLVINALDNIAARKYTDGKCVLHRKPLFESGTLGTKANTIVCLPDQTPSYSEGVVAGEGQGIAQCTLRNFPSIPLHCIEWARAMFDDWFVQGPDVVNNFLQDPKAWFTKLPNNPPEELEALELCAKWVELAINASPETCVAVMFDRLLANFRNNILDLTHAFPKDARNVHPESREDLGPFWHGHKRFPTALVWDPKDPEQINFLFRGANILASSLNVPPLKLEQVSAMAATLSAPEWKPSNAAINLEETADKKKDTNADPEKKAALIAFLTDAASKKLKSLNPTEFEKDDDTNHHVDVITAATNLRSKNYEIRTSSLTECRLVAGRIIPAIATTTACITGFIGIEVFKHISQLNLQARRMATINLATNVFCVENLPDPIKAKDGLDPKSYTTFKAVPQGFTTWDTIVIHAPGVTLKEFINKLAEVHHGVRATMLSTGENKVVYNEAMEYLEEVRLANQAKMGAPLLNAVQEAIGGQVFPSDRNYVVFDATVDIDGEDGIVPRIKWIFK